RAAADWVRKMIEAHDQPHAAIGGAIENEVNRSLNWAVYFCDFGRYQNPVIGGPSDFLSDVNVSYKRDTLLQISDIWKDGFHEPSVHSELKQAGAILWLSSQIVVYQHRENLTVGKALKERFEWGRYFAANRTHAISTTDRWVYFVLSPVLPVILTLRKI